MFKGEVREGTALWEDAADEDGNNDGTDEPVDDIAAVFADELCDVFEFEDESRAASPIQLIADADGGIEDVWEAFKDVAWPEPMAEAVKSITFILYLFNLFIAFQLKYF